jgi:hypothetical protein
MLEMDNSISTEEENARLAERLTEYNAGIRASPAAAAAAVPAKAEFAKSALAPPVQELMELLFDAGMIKQAMHMSAYGINTAKLPLSKLSKSRIAKGYDILTEIEDAIAKSESTAKLNELSSKFYSLVRRQMGREAGREWGTCATCTLTGACADVMRC